MWIEIKSKCYNFNKIQVFNYWLPEEGGKPLMLLVLDDLTEGTFIEKIPYKSKKQVIQDYNKIKELLEVRSV